MPTYNYKCKCGNTLEKFYNHIGTYIEQCTQCNDIMEKIIVAGHGGLIFKGSGFYETDYKQADTTKRKYVQICKDEVNKEKQAIETAKKDKEICREMYGEEKLIPIQELPNYKDVEKVGNEVRSMKRCGENRERIDRELNPEVHKLTNLNKRGN